MCPGTQGSGRAGNPRGHCSWAWGSRRWSLAIGFTVRELVIFSFQWVPRSSSFLCWGPDHASCGCLCAVGGWEGEGWKYSDSYILPGFLSCEPGSPAGLGFKACPPGCAHPGPQATPCVSILVTSLLPYGAAAAEGPYALLCHFLTRSHPFVITLLLSGAITGPSLILYVFSLKPGTSKFS